MTKLQFLLSLHDKLSGLPDKDVEERLNFYTEMIEDRMEEGLSEEDAVAAVGSVEQIADQILSESPSSQNPVEKPAAKKQRKAWQTVLLVLGSPLWLSLLIAVVAIVFSLYISLWAVVISLWAVLIALVACAFGITATGISTLLSGNHLPGIALIAAGAVCAGISIFLLLGCKAATKGTAILLKKTLLGIKNCFIQKEEAK